MNNNNQSILITVSGPDQPGITAKLMSIIANNGQRVLDMGQSVTHNFLSLSILIDRGDPQSSVVKDLLFQAKELGLSLDFQILDSSEVVRLEGDRFILTCVSPNGLTPHFIGELAQKLASFNINIRRIDNVTKQFNSLEIQTHCCPTTNWQEVKPQLIAISNKHQIDMAFLKDSLFRRTKRLIAMDMDSTLIQVEVIDEMAKALGIGTEIEKITAQAMNGEIDFETSLRKRVEKLKGLDMRALEKIREQLPLTPGAEDFIRTVKKMGYKVALISGGFNYFTNYLKDKLGLDYAFGNTLGIEDEKLNGKVEGTIVTANHKAWLLEMLAQQEGIDLEQIVAIGDGANDLPMLAKAGLGVAFHAKDVVKKNASHNLSYGPMTSILYFLGIPEEAIHG